MIPRFQICKARWVLVPSIEIGNTGGRQGFGGKITNSVSDSFHLVHEISSRQLKYGLDL